MRGFDFTGRISVPVQAHYRTADSYIPTSHPRRLERGFRSNGQENNPGGLSRDAPPAAAALGSVFSLGHLFEDQFVDREICDSSL
jgi:hypothetical protein